MHLDGFRIWSGIACEGMMTCMIDGHGVGRNWKGYYPTEFIEMFGRNVRAHAEELSVTTKTRMLLARYMDETYHGRYYARAQNLARSLAAAYDSALRQFDVLVMPTTPIKAAKIPGPDAPLEEQIVRGGEMISNTCPFDATGHPAVNVPCAMSEGLPVGMMCSSGGWETTLRSCGPPTPSSAMSSRRQPRPHARSEPNLVLS
jgi:amidase